MSELVSVIMSVYNERPEWLRKSVESILNQTYRKIEFIIILDNPENQELQSIIEDYLQCDERIIFVKNEINLGLVKSLNRGIQMSKGSIIARMDADDISYPERIKCEMEYMNKESVDFIMASADFLYDVEIIRNVDYGELDNDQIKQLMKYGNVSLHPTWLVRKSVFEKLNGYRECMYCEDLDFILRALQAGFTCFRIREHLLLYRIRENGISQKNGLEQYENSKILKIMYAKGKIIGNYDIPQKNEYTHKCLMMYNRADAIFQNIIKEFQKGITFKRILLMSVQCIRNHYVRELMIKSILFYYKLFLINCHREY